MLENDRFGWKPRAFKSFRCLERSNTKASSAGLPRVDGGRKILRPVEFERESTIVVIPVISRIRLHSEGRSLTTLCVFTPWFLRAGT